MMITQELGKDDPTEHLIKGPQLESIEKKKSAICNHVTTNLFMTFADCQSDSFNSVKNWN